jgi:hypothetical protein
MKDKDNSWYVPILVNFLLRPKPYINFPLCYHLSTHPVTIWYPSLDMQELYFDFFVDADRSKYLHLLSLRS